MDKIGPLELKLAQGGEINIPLPFLGQEKEPVSSSGSEYTLMMREYGIPGSQSDSASDFSVFSQDMQNWRGSELSCAKEGSKELV